MSRLHYFVTLAQTGSLTKASELLHISQPALSKAIKTLEGEIDEKLIIPSGRGIAITDFGLRLVEQSTPLFELYDRLKNIKKTPLKEEIKIATFEVFSSYFMSEVITRNFPDKNVSLLEKIPGEIEEAISSYQADIGITYMPIPQPDLDILKVSSINMELYGLKKKFEKYDIQTVPFVAPRSTISGTPTKAKGIDGWPDDKIPRNIRFHVDLLETALQLSSQGLCIGYFPSFVVESYNSCRQANQRLQVLKRPTKLKNTTYPVYMIKRKSDLENQSFKKISRELRKLIDNNR